MSDECGQINDHRRQIVRYIEWRLKTVSKFFGEIKAMRAQRYAEYENVSKLSNLAHDFEEKSKATISTAAAVAAEYEAADRQYANQMDDELSPEELQMFEAENIEMYNELNRLSNEVCLYVFLFNIYFDQENIFLNILGEKYRV